MPLQKSLLGRGTVSFPALRSQKADTTASPSITSNVVLSHHTTLKQAGTDGFLTAQPHDFPSTRANRQESAKTSFQWQPTGSSAYPTYSEGSKNKCIIYHLEISSMSQTQFHIMQHFFFFLNDMISLQDSVLLCTQLSFK